MFLNAAPSIASTRFHEGSVLGLYTPYINTPSHVSYVMAGSFYETTAGMTLGGGQMTLSVKHAAARSYTPIAGASFSGNPPDTYAFVGLRLTHGGVYPDPTVVRGDLATVWRSVATASY